MKRNLIDQEKRFREARRENASESLPFVRLKDYPNRSSSICSSFLPNDPVQLFQSNLERNCYCALCFDGRAKEIRSQYPLEIKKTLAIAKALGVKHPMTPGTKRPNYLTTDLYAKLFDSREVAIAVKETKELEDKRVREKLQVERNYWKNEGGIWLIFTEKSVSQTMADNCRYLLHTQKPSENLLMKENELIKLLESSKQSLLEVTRFFDRTNNFVEGSGLHLFHYLVAEKRIGFDMEQPITEPGEIYYGQHCF